MTPLLFVLVTACIIPAIEEDAEITRAFRGRHRIAAFMDDIKTHAPTKKATELIKSKLEKTSGELGLLLNVRKCGIYASQTTEEEAEEDIPFLPIVRDGYKYLGLHQTERDTPINMVTLTNKLEQKLAVILTSKLAPSQKVTLINNTLIPAAVYVTGNLYPDEARATTLKKCADVDKSIRKALIHHNLLGKTSPRALAYIPTSLGGLGVKSLMSETEAQYVRKSIYLQHHPDMKETEAEYKRLAATGWRNPITDALHVIQTYELEIPPKEEPSDPLNAYCRRVVGKLHQAQESKTLQSWTTSSHYARLNCDTVPRDFNLVEALARMHKAPVKLSVMIIGALGEILETLGLTNAYRHLRQLGATRDDLRDLENRCSRSVCVATAKIIMRRLTMRPHDSA
ncbi:unnamed protein product [Trichogramma brassicae]|uniref:Reverse transcriptase domain-containing protein n=1 Tax=Trichogramma brassicae TaxID=86971 RepID=A0A6H5I2H9_9HYME|nr:unnamed protein product [Trichogramma brassicae]